MSDLWSYCPSCDAWVHWITTLGPHGRTGPSRCPACGYTPQVASVGAAPASRSPEGRGGPVPAVIAVA